MQVPTGCLVVSSPPESHTAITAVGRPGRPDEPLLRLLAATGAGSRDCAALRRLSTQFVVKTGERNPIDGSGTVCANQPSTLAKSMKS